MTLQPGTILGPYEVVGALGTGGMGEVYRARDERLHREVAIKILPAAVGNDPSALARFEREARAVAALSHPNILSIYDVGTHGDVHFAVMELVDGETLRVALADGRLPPRRALDYAAQISEALAAAHDRGIVHRDIKPENAIVTPEGRVKVLDFGLAKPNASTLPRATGATDARTVERLTDTGIVVGTVGYMSPEQVRGQTVDHRSDIFSLGVVLYEMLLGERPFRGDSAVETMAAILKEEAPELVSRVAGVSPSIDQIVRRCLEKNPAARFQSAQDLAFAVGSLARLSSSTQQITVDRPTRRRWASLTSMIVVAVLAAAAGFVAGQRLPSIEYSPLTFQPLTYGGEAIFNARFAPDGRTVIYSAARQGSEPELFVLRPEQRAPQSLGLPRTHLLSVSRQGELAVLTNAKWINHRLFSGTLARMTLGAAPREILENVREADWAPDGQSLAVVRDVEAKDRLEFPVGTLLYESAGYLSDPRVSPRGDHVAVYDHPTRYDNRGHLVIVGRDRRVTVLARDAPALEGLAWTPDGTELIASMPQSASSLMLAPFAFRLSGERRSALQSAGEIVALDIARDGRWLTYSDDMALSVMALGPGQKAERDLSWLDESMSPRLSNDGTAIAFADQKNPNYTVLLRKTDGSPITRLGEGFPTTAPSPDGKWVLALIPTPSQVVVYPTGAGDAVRPPRGAIETYEWADWFPGGREILVCGNEANRATRCYRQSLPAGEPEPVTPEGTRTGKVSPTGQRVIVKAGDGSARVYDLTGGVPFAVPIDRDETVLGWSVDGRAIYTSKPRVPARIDRVDVATGQRALVKELAPADQTGVITVWAGGVSDDERAYAYSYWRRLSRLFVVENVR